MQSNSIPGNSNLTKDQADIVFIDGLHVANIFFKVDYIRKQVEDTPPNSEESRKLCAKISEAAKFVLRFLHEHTGGIIYRVLDQPAEEIFTDALPAKMLGNSIGFDFSPDKMLKLLDNLFPFVDLIQLGKIVKDLSKELQKRRILYLISAHVELEFLISKTKLLSTPEDTAHFQSMDLINQRYLTNVSNFIIKVEEKYDLWLEQDEESTHLHANKDLNSQVPVEGIIANFTTMPDMVLTGTTLIRQFIKVESLNEINLMMKQSLSLLTIKNILSIFKNLGFFLMKFFDDHAHGSFSREFTEFKNLLESAMVRAILKRNSLNEENSEIDYYELEFLINNEKSRGVAKEISDILNIQQLINFFISNAKMSSITERIKLLATLFFEAKHLLINARKIQLVYQVGSPGRFLSPFNQAELDEALSIVEKLDFKITPPKSFMKIMSPEIKANSSFMQSEPVYFSEEKTDYADIELLFENLETLKGYFNLNKIYQKIDKSLPQLERKKLIINCIAATANFLLYLHVQCKNEIKKFLQNEKFFSKLDEKHYDLVKEFINHDFFAKVQELTEKSSAKLKLLRDATVCHELDFLIDKIKSLNSDNGVVNSRLITYEKHKENLQNTQEYIETNYKSWLDADEKATHLHITFPLHNTPLPNTILNLDCISDLFLMGTATLRQFIKKDALSVIDKRLKDSAIFSNLYLSIDIIVITFNFLLRFFDDQTNKKISNELLITKYDFEHSVIKGDLIRVLKGKSPFPTCEIRLENDRRDQKQIIENFFDLPTLCKHLRTIFDLSMMERLKNFTTLFFEARHVLINVRKIKLLYKMGIPSQFLAPADRNELNEALDKIHKKYGRSINHLINSSGSPSASAQQNVELTKAPTNSSPSTSSIPESDPEEIKKEEARLKNLEKINTIEFSFKRTQSFLSELPGLQKRLRAVAINPLLDWNEFSGLKNSMREIGDNMLIEILPLAEKMEKETSANLNLSDAEYMQLKERMKSVENAIIKIKNYAKEIDLIAYQLTDFVKKQDKIDRTELAVKAIQIRKEEKNRVEKDDKDDEKEDEKEDEKKEQKESRRVPHTVRPTAKIVSALNQPLTQATMSTTPLVSQPPLKILYLRQACTNLVFIRQILDIYFDTLSSDVRHYALLYNIFRFVQSLKEYQEKGGNTRKINSTEVADLRNMFRHGPAATNEKEVLDFASSMKIELPQAILELNRPYMTDMAELKENEMKHIIEEFGIEPVTNQERAKNRSRTCSVIQNSTLYKSLITFHQLKDNNNDENVKRKLILSTYIPAIKKIIAILNQKGTSERTESPQIFLEASLFQIQALRMLAAICGELALPYKGLEPNTISFLNFCAKKVKNKVGHALVDMEFDEEMQQPGALSFLNQIEALVEAINKKPEPGAGRYSVFAAGPEDDKKEHNNTKSKWTPKGISSSSTRAYNS